MTGIVGQKHLLEQIDTLVKTSKPRFYIIVGPAKSGKTLISKYLTKKLGATLTYSSLKVDDVRTTIETAYKVETPVMYVFKGTDDMSVAAKNALLKVTEEPPRNAYFIMTVEREEEVLPTLRSRGTVLKLDSYSRDELTEYIDNTEAGADVTDEELDIILDVCTNIGEVSTLLKYDIIEFYSFVDKVVDNVGVVSGANAFKISSFLALSKKDLEEAKKYDVTLFFNLVLRVYSHRMREVIYNERDYGDDIEFLIAAHRDSILVTTKYLAQLVNKSINKQSTFDMWCLEIRGVWVEN